MATVKPVQIAANERALYMLDSMGRLWLGTVDKTDEDKYVFSWKPMELPEELPA